ncbi:hypothetical protein AUC31_06795 [Planococcus rifietoensis]|uniref:Uncharacterized protein n=1 Tax=Planococcus rifietoensis TaxID=200991 RepID=A0A0U2PAH8_9BACL|nr:hypothetical protein AUC31_06795 [Planococcus rifietoensis]
MLLVISVIDFIVALITRSYFKVRILKGGMYMLKQTILKVRNLLSNLFVKAFLLILGVWSSHPLP